MDLNNKGSEVYFLILCCKNILSRAQSLFQTNHLLRTHKAIATEGVIQNTTR